MRHRQRRKRNPRQQADRHVCCRHAGRPLLTARRWVWLASSVAAGLIAWSAYTDTVAQSINLYFRCNTPGVTCHAWQDGPSPMRPTVPSTWGI